MPRSANPYRPEYAKIISDARIKHNLSQLQLGQLIGRDAASIKKYEGGKVLPPFFVLMKIADVLALDKRELAELVIRRDADSKWLDAALEDIAWIFNQIDVDIETHQKPSQVFINHGTVNNTFDKLNFLFELSAILDSAHDEYVHIVTSKASNFVKSILSGKY